MKQTKYQFKSTMGRISKRLSPIVGTVGVLIFAASPMLSGVAHASGPGQLQYRSIDMSSDVVSATNTQYKVSFSPTTASQTIEGVVVDFCAEDPIPGDTCTLPTGMSLGTPTLASTTLGGVTGGSWSAAVGTDTTAVVITSSTTGTTGATVASDANAVTFTIQGLTNPSSDHTSFYARIFTYALNTGATGYSATAIGSPLDDGGVALSTSDNVVITSKVQEQLTFCIYNGSACAGNSISLGNSKDVLSIDGAFVDNSTQYQLESNALHDAAITVQGNTLTSGSNTIEASAASGTDSGDTDTAADASIVGTPQFGMCSWAISDPNSTINVNSTYASTGSDCSSLSSNVGTDVPNASVAGTFGFNLTNITSTFGDTLATVAPGATVTGGVAFMANIAPYTVAGIYTTTLNFIATGTY